MIQILLEFTIELQNLLNVQAIKNQWLVFCYINNINKINL